MAGGQRCGLGDGSSQDMGHIPAARLGTERVWVFQGKAGVGSTHSTPISAVGALTAHMGVLKPLGESSLSHPMRFPDVVFALAAPFTSCRQPWSGDFLPPMACLEVATSMDEMDFSTSKVRARSMVEEENSTQMNSHLAVTANITGFHHEKGKQRKGFKWLLLLVHLIFPPFADPFN